MNLSALLTETAQRSPSGIAIVHGGSRLSWSSLESRVVSFARGLADRGFVPGDRIAIVTSNRTEFVVAYFGALRAGLIAVPINPALTAHELGQRTEDATPSLVVCDSTSEVAVREALMDNGLGTEMVVPVGGPAWGDLARDDHPEAEFPSTDPESTAVLLFTAGTSGRPRPAMLSHRALLANLDQLAALDPVPMAQDDVVLLMLPLFHAYPLNGVLGLAVRQGATVVLERRFDAEESLNIVEREGVTNIPAGPGTYLAWSSRTDLAERLAGVRTLISGAAPLPAAVAAQFPTISGHVVWEGYGVTEAGPVITSTLVSGNAVPGSVGQPLPGVELRVLDSDGDEVEEDDPGEVVVRGPNLFSGYWPDGADGPDAEGWFATRDVAYRDEAGDLHLVDRAHDLILVSGFSVYPREVELAVESLEGVAECAVVGVEHPMTGEAVKALVVPVAGADITGEAVLAHCSTRLARFKCPTIVELVEALPRTPAGKVVRRELRS